MIPSWRRRAAQILSKLAAQLDPNFRGTTLYPPGSFYSPLLDLDTLNESLSRCGSDTANDWTGIELRAESQRTLLKELFSLPDRPVLSETPHRSCRYYSNNEYFRFSDAFLLARMMARFTPKRIIEVGSGFSSAVMLDTREALQAEVALTFIEPYPDRLRSLLREEDAKSVRILQSKVQSVSLEEFERLEAGDFLFIDSSHVAKVGSDLNHLFARVLPRLSPGVFVHFHDIFYPGPYPAVWLREGRAWNEVLFLQTFLRFNTTFEMVLFNGFVTRDCKDLAEQNPRFFQSSGGSAWLRRGGSTSNVERPTSNVQ